MITIIKLALARYVHRPMSTLLSIILFTIGVAIISLIVKSEWYLQNNYKQNLAGIDLVVGAKGSPLQLILSSVLHVDAPTGNIPLEEVHKIENNPLVKKTIPIALGDNYKGFRIVGTNTDYVELYNAQLNEGEMFSKPLEAVVGANVAKESGLKLQDNFVGAHGFMHQGHSHDEFEYSVTGVLKPTGTIIDNLVLTPVESVWLVHSHIEEHQHDEEVHDTEHNHHEHVHENHNKKSEDKHLHEAAIDEILHKIENGEEISEEELHIYNKHKGILTEKEHHPEKEITSLLVFYQNPMAVARLPRMINENTTLQAASPALEFNRLLSLLGYGITVLEILAWIIIIISGINIFIYLLNTINQSIGEIALLRATGVSRPRVFMLILCKGHFYQF
jgi:putative ABC transport system permease protein